LLAEKTDDAGHENGGYCGGSGGGGCVKLVTAIMTMKNMIKVRVVIIVNICFKRNKVLEQNAIMVLVSTIMMSTKATLGTPVHSFRNQSVVLSAGHRLQSLSRQWGRRGSGGDCCEVYKKQTKRYERNNDQTCRCLGAVDGVLFWRNGVPLPPRHDCAPPPPLSPLGLPSGPSAVSQTFWNS
jgi:hypothetical protein